jgi:phosphate transport system substrate-binding protein
MITVRVMHRYRGFVFLLCALAVSSLMLTCSEPEDPTSGRVVVIGSESVRRAMDNECHEFMAMYEKATARAVGGGSIAGLQAIFDAPVKKDTMVAVSTRPLSDAERAAATRKGFDPKEYRIAMDGIAMIVNTANPVDSLTLDQLRDVLSGRISNWRQVGGRDEPIKVVFGNTSSATYTELRDSVIGTAGLAATTTTLDSMAAIIHTVQDDPTAIGYCGSAYLHQNWFSHPPTPEPRIKALALSRTAAGPFVTPDPGTVYDKSYPLWRYVYLIARREPRGIAGGFVTFVMSSKGQQILVQDGLAPVTVKFTVHREGEE